jgi:GNAT superfamily N-acetyltransferase
MNNDVMTYSPDDLSNEDIEACISLIREGGASYPKSVPELTRAMVVAIVHDGHEIVGVGAIKEKRPEYASIIARRSGFRFNKNIHELGYVAVNESHRGLGLSYAITVKLLATFRERPLFATTANKYMKGTLEQAGFVRRGNEWPGFSGELSLWIKYVDSMKKPTADYYRNLKIWK